MSLRAALKNGLPKGVYTFFKQLEVFRQNGGAYFYCMLTGTKRLQQVNRYFKAHPEENVYQKELAFYRKRHTIATVFPYPLLKQVDKNVTMGYDSEKEMPFIHHKGNKLYLPNAYSWPDNAIGYYRTMLMEQLPQSPHRYTADDFNIGSDDILFDVGCADALFALEHADTAKEIYLFECNPAWLSALEATFAPYREKTHIIPRLVSDTEKESESVRLDSYLKPGDSAFIKMDVEGCEAKVLAGLGSAFETCQLKVSCCTYHNAQDGADFMRFFEKKGLRASYSDGYILFFRNNETVLQPPFFRRGLIRAQTVPNGEKKTI